VESFLTTSHKSRILSYKSFGLVLSEEKQEWPNSGQFVIRKKSWNPVNLLCKPRHSYQTKYPVVSEIFACAKMCFFGKTTVVNPLSTSEITKLKKAYAMQKEKQI
jgi:hypothetical protein